jgi:glutamate/tyrosine decarboxylase-like PLP-dependent enzyme
MLLHVHGFNDETDLLADDVLRYARSRLRSEPAALNGTRSPAELNELAGATITAGGLGARDAFNLFATVLSKACISNDHPANLSFIPAAPTPAAVFFDLAVSASSVYGGSWLEGAGAVYAENQALRWLADLAGFPPDAGGVFVQGGTLGNLSALVTARDAAAARRTASGVARPVRWRVLCGDEAHSSVAGLARVMDADLLTVATPDGRLTGDAVARALAERGAEGVFAIVATAGTTQFGIVDDLRGIARVARERGVWLHADGAYGLAAMAAPSAAGLFDGIADADSFIVDPHKWLFAPFDACALLYRDPAFARAAHTQQAGYLDVLSESGEWNPSDLAVHQSRRPRGLPFWFSLATHGTNAYRDAVESVLATARAAADLVRAAVHLELVREPQLSILVFRRRGWVARDYHAWSDALLKQNLAFVPPTVHDGETVARLALVNPRTSVRDIARILASAA